MFKGFGISFFINFSAILLLSHDLNQLYMVENTGVLGEKNTAQPQVNGNFLTCPGGTVGELAVSGNALDHTAIMAGPYLILDSQP